MGSVKSLNDGHYLPYRQADRVPEVANRNLGTHLMTEIEIMYRNVSRFELFIGSRSTKNFHYTIN